MIVIVLECFFNSKEFFPLVLFLWFQTFNLFSRVFYDERKSFLFFFIIFDRYYRSMISINLRKWIKKIFHFVFRIHTFCFAYTLRTKRKINSNFQIFSPMIIKKMKINKNEMFASNILQCSSFYRFESYQFRFRFFFARRNNKSLNPRYE